MQLLVYEVHAQRDTEPGRGARYLYLRLPITILFNQCRSAGAADLCRNFLKNRSKNHIIGECRLSVALLGRRSRFRPGLRPVWPAMRGSDRFSVRGEALQPAPSTRALSPCAYGAAENDAPPALTCRQSGNSGPTLSRSFC